MQDRGRPPRVRWVTSSERLEVRLTWHEREQLEALARARGTAVSDVVRQALVKMTEQARRPEA